VAEKTVAKELIQDEVNAELISEEIVNILNDKNYSDTIKKEFSALKNKVSVAHQNSSKMVAEIAMRMIS
jgi:lipid A disaccharide synthetase